MIIKSFELNKNNLNKHNFYLFHGKNEGQKNQIINDFKGKDKEFFIYEEKEVLDNLEDFIERILTNSLFEKEKVIVIKRTSDKILKLLESLNTRKIYDITVILNADVLDKKSKLRNFFEKSREYICSAFYPDNEQTLIRLASNFIRERKINISQSNINLIIERSNNDRIIMLNELEKVEFYCKAGKKISSEKLSKLTNLIENHSISELVNNCLAKDKKKISNILNENIFSNDDCILIIRTFLNKAKKVLILSNNYEKNNNLEKTISTAKPPIFWKDKEITKKQIMLWKPESLKELIYKLGEVEHQIKINFDNSINIITDFILEQTSNRSSN